VISWFQTLLSNSKCAATLGRWLAAPHGKQWEVGSVAVMPWLALAAAASVALCNGLVGPATLWSAQTLGLVGRGRGGVDDKEGGGANDKKAK
jgi:hypothetical protein